MISKLVRLHNFADDTCMLVGTHEDASIVAKEFNLHTRKFRSRVHVATAANPISKSVAVHMPATTQTTTAHTHVGKRGGNGMDQLRQKEFVPGSVHHVGAEGRRGDPGAHPKGFGNAWVSEEAFAGVKRRVVFGEEEGDYRDDPAHHVGRR